MSGAFTDGVTNVLVDDGVAVVVTREGQVRTTHRLANLFSPPKFVMSVTTALGVLSGLGTHLVVWMGGGGIDSLLAESDAGYGRTNRRERH